MLPDENVRKLLVSTGLNEYELAVKLVQQIHLHAQGRPEKQTK